MLNFLSQVRVLSDRVFLKEKINAQKSCFLASRSQREAADAFSKLSLLCGVGVSIAESIFVFGRVLKTLHITASRTWFSP